MKLLDPELDKRIADWQTATDNMKDHWTKESGQLQSACGLLIIYLITQYNELQRRLDWEQDSR